MAKNNQITASDDAAEFKVVRRDLTFVIIMNLVFLAALLGLYFFNRASGQVDNFFSHFLKF